MIEVRSSDIDFYEGKIKTLEQDNCVMHEEIMKLRARLRIAEDYEIKYSLLVSTNQKEIDRLKANLEKQEEVRLKEILSAKMKECDEHWHRKLKEYQAQLKKDAEENIQKLAKDLLQKNQQLQSIKSKREQAELFGFKMGKLQKENENLRLEIQETKKFYQEQRKEEISRLRTTLNNSYRQRIANQQKKYETKIEDLMNRINQLEVKDANITYKPNETTNRQLSALKNLLNEKAKEYQKQIEECRRAAELKNDQILQALQQNIQIQERYRREIQIKNQYIKQLEDKIIEREKQHEIQLLHQIERFKIANDQQKQELIQQINRLNSEISRSQELWRDKIANHQNEISDLNNKFDEERRRLIQEKNMNKRKILELNLKMKESEGEREMGETQMLINSLRDIDVKGDQLGNYENGITFLQRQYKKCQLKLEEKSRIVSKLYKDINEIRTQAERQITELKEKVRKDRKYYSDKILSLQNQAREISQQLKNKDKQAKKRERDYQKEKSELQSQKAALKELNNQLQRDYNRVIEGKKDVQASYRDQKQKSFASRSDLNLIKKQKWLQLQKQKNELQIIFKEKQQQVKLQYEQPIDELKNQLNKLKQDYEISKQENQFLQKENQKLLGQLEMNKQNDRMAEYNKKLASLNLEIALTQNICQSLKKAKSRVNPAASPAEFTSELEDKHFGTEFDSQFPLTMSFCPSPMKRM